jgi:hypothetical protein
MDMHMQQLSHTLQLTTLLSLQPYLYSHHSIKLQPATPEHAYVPQHA